MEGRDASDSGGAESVVTGIKEKVWSAYNKVADTVMGSVSDDSATRK